MIRISRLDEGGVPYQWEELDLYSMVHDIFSTLHEAARKQEVHMYMEGGSTMLDTVPTIMEEVLYNVCDNAIKYNHRGGEVFVQLKDEGDVVRINVRDTGIGIPKEDQERIFERFYRVDKSHSKEIGGTGLGLSIVKHGVKTLNGRLWLNSEPGQGTEIIMEFPKHHMEKEAKRVRSVCCFFCREDAPDTDLTGRCGYAILCNNNQNRKEESGYVVRFLYYSEGNKKDDTGNYFTGVPDLSELCFRRSGNCGSVHE